MTVFPGRVETGSPSSATFIVRVKADRAAGVGNGGPDRLEAGSESALTKPIPAANRADAREWIAKARVDASVALAQAQVALESRLAAAAKVTDDAAAAIQAHREGVEARSRGRVQQSSIVDDMKQAIAGRRSALEELQRAAKDLLSAVNEWQRIEEQRQNSEAALVSLRERTISSSANLVDLETVVSDMLEAERMLWRADNRRSDAVVSAEGRLVSARESAAISNSDLRKVISAWCSADDSAGRFPLMGLLPLQEILAGRVSGSKSAESALLDTLAAARDRQSGIESELSALQAGSVPEIAHPSVILGQLRELSVASGSAALIVDDLLAEVDDATTAAVLRGLPDCLEGRPLTYLTADPRVLAWAMTLPEDVGGIAGVHTGAAQD